MPQEFYVLRCFSCDTFQVHIVKKAKKWECKMCGAKQSLKRNYGKGSSKDCRAQVMKLNELRLSKSETPDEFENEDIDEKLVEIDIPEDQQDSLKKKPGVSKWAEYLDEEPEETEENEEGFYKTLFGNSKQESKKRVWNTDKKSNKKKKVEEESRENEEQSHSFETLNSVENFKFNKANEKMNDNHSFVQSKSTGKQSKYSKYLDEDESENNDDLLGNVKKSSNIFDTDPTDLDSILNF